MKSYIIGDIHGCYNELDTFLVNNNINPKKDIIYTLGDLIDKGPDSIGVLELVFNIKYNFTNILGNHDYYFLKFLEKKLDILLPFNEGKSQIGYLNKKIKQDDRLKHKKLLKEVLSRKGLIENIINGYLPYFKEKDFILVHGGIIPGKKLKKHKINELIHTNYINGKFWAERYKGKKRIFYGHHSKRKKKEIGNTLNLDFGVTKTGCLAGFDLQKNKIITNI